MVRLTKYEGDCSMDVQATTEIRDLAAEETEAVTGGWFCAFAGFLYSQPIELECEQDPLGQGTTVGNCLII
jgi:hypothetical protein